MGLFGGGGFGGGGGLFRGGGGLFGGGGFGGGNNACSSGPRFQPPRQIFRQPQPRPQGGGFLPRLGDGLRTLGPPALGLATAITSLSAPTPPAGVPASYPPPAVASTPLPPLFPTSGDDALPLSNTSLSPGGEVGEGGYTTEEAELRAEVTRILADAKAKRERDRRERQADALGDAGVEVADAGGAVTEDQLEDAD